VKRISFANTINPKSYFDLIRYEDIQNKEHIDHCSTDYHIIDFFAIIIFAKGKGQHAIDFTTYDCAQRSLLTIRKGQVHKFHKSSKLSGSLLLFTTGYG
jgi:hypothetical protein